MKILLVFRGTHNDFRFAELRAVLARVRGCAESECDDICVTPAQQELDWSREPRSDIAGVVLYGHVFCFAHFQSVAEATEVVRHCVLLRAAFIPLAHGRDYDECVIRANDSISLEVCSDMLDPTQKRSFKCVVEAFGRKYTMSEQLERMEKFKDLFECFRGPVKLADPEVEFWIMEDAFPATGHKSNDRHGNARQVFLGRKIASGAGHLGHRFHLSRRRYIGPTSMDAELAFVMANMAQIRPGDVVLDPFCGTGSILVSCAWLGAHVVGSDLNLKVLRGKCDGNCVLSNFSQYGVPLPIGVLRADLLHSPFKSRRQWVDAVICDPPYGIKEGTRAFREENDFNGSMKRTKHSIPGTQRVVLVEFIEALLQFSADMLVPGGRLVYWLPTTPEYDDADVPSHPALELLSNCEQVITMRMCRRLITMQRLTSSEERKVSTASVQCSVTQEKRALRKPAHFDFAAKILRQPSRSDTKVISRYPVSQE